MDKIVVTGASGFVGRHCLPLLLARGYEVHAIGRKRIQIPEWEDLAWHEADLLAPGVPTRLMIELHPEVLLHLAWSPAIPGQFWNAPDNIEWARSSLELLHAFRANGGRRAVAAGSCAEYGRAEGECREQSTSLAPTTLYGVAKHGVRAIADAWSRQVGLSFAWGRLFFLYGPHEHPSRVVAYVIRSLLRAEAALCSDAGQELDFLYVKDAAAALVAVLESEVSGPVNIASGAPVRLRRMLEEIGKQIGRVDLIHFGARESEQPPQRFWGNASRLATEANWQPSYDLTTGIRETIAWWQSQQT